MNLAETQICQRFTAIKSIPFDYVELEFATGRTHRDTHFKLLLRTTTEIATLIRSNFPSLWREAVQNPRTWRLRNE